VPLTRGSIGVAGFVGMTAGGPPFSPGPPVSPGRGVVPPPGGDASPMAPVQDAKDDAKDKDRATDTIAVKADACGNDRGNGRNQTVRDMGPPR
jgi:hypothetical protein